MHTIIHSCHFLHLLSEVCMLASWPFHFPALTYGSSDIRTLNCALFLSRFNIEQLQGKHIQRQSGLGRLR